MTIQPLSYETAIGPLYDWRLAADHLRTPYLGPRENQADWFQAIRGNPFEAWYEVDGAAIFGLSRIHWVNRSAEVSFLHAPDATRPGAILAECCAYAFDHLNLYRLEAEAYTDARRDLFIAAGFEVEGIATGAFYRDGARQDATRLAYLVGR